MSKKCVRASPVLLLRGPVTSPPPHTLTHTLTGGRGRRAPADITESYTYTVRSRLCPRVV
jgi:hypothetical protein